jgi:two-component system NarL family response regulator
VASCAGVEEALRALDETGADVVLLPVRLSAAAGDRLSAIGDDVCVVVVVDDPHDPDVAAALRSGAAGYLSAAAPVAEFADAIRGVTEGSLHVSAVLTPVLLRELARDGAAEPPLTERELQVLRLMADGASNRDIAERLYISENTVKNHVRHILEKTGTRSRMGAVARALRDGLVQIA